MGFEISYKKRPKKNKKITKTEELKHRYQYTKKAMNIILFIFLRIALSSCYINLKNGFSMDTIFTVAGDILWKCIGFYCVKSVTETYLENKTNKEIRSNLSENIINQNDDLGRDI